MSKHLFFILITIYSISYSQNKKLNLSDLKILEFPSYSIEDIEFDSKGNSWLVRVGGNLIKFKDQKNIKIYKRDNSDLKYTFIKDIAIDTNDNIWLASADVIKFDGENWQYFNKSTNLNIRHPDKIFIDKANRIWVTGNGKGISILQGKEIENDFIEKNPLLKKGLGTGWIYYFSENNIWTSSREMMFHYDGKNWKEFSNDLFHGSTYNYVYTFYYNKSSKKYWLGTWEKGLVSVDKKTLQFSSIDLTLSNSDSKFLTGEEAHQYWNGDIDIDKVSKVGSDELFITSIAEHNDILYIGTNYNGLIIKDGNYIYNLNPKNSGILSQTINTIKIDSEHKIWIGTTKGLNILSYK